METRRACNAPGADMGGEDYPSSASTSASGLGSYLRCEEEGRNTRPAKARRFPYHQTMATRRPRLQSRYPVAGNAETGGPATSARGIPRCSTGYLRSWFMDALSRRSALHHRRPQTSASRSALVAAGPLDGRNGSGRDAASRVDSARSVLAGPSSVPLPRQRLARPETPRRDRRRYRPSSSRYRNLSTSYVRVSVARYTYWRDGDKPSGG